MQVLQRVADGQNPGDDLLFGQWPPTLTIQLLLQVLSVYEVHNEVEPRAPLEVFAHLGDVVVVERLEPLRLVLELAAGRARLVGHFLEGVDILLAEDDVADAIDGAQATPADYRLDAVAFMDDGSHRQWVQCILDHSPAPPSSPHRQRIVPVSQTLDGRIVRRVPIPARTPPCGRGMAPVYRPTPLHVNVCAVRAS